MISLWVMKAIVQKGISFLPWSHRINFFFQKYVTGGVRLSDEHFGLKLGHAREHLESLHRHRGRDKNLSILELGTGWYPVVPLLFYLSSSGKVRSVDIRSWMTPGTQQLTLQKFREWKERGLLDDLWPMISKERWDRIMDLGCGSKALPKQEFNALIGLESIVGDARKLGIGDNSIDFICSNNTFEHIPAPVLKDILAEFWRVLRPGGLMNHFIDMSDHFAHFDKSIGIYNFLKYSGRKWRRIDNSIQPQNRMRLKDYKAMYAELGIAILSEEIRPGNPEDLEHIRVHHEFSNYSPEELAVSHASLVSVK